MSRFTDLQKVLRFLRKVYNSKDHIIYKEAGKIIHVSESEAEGIIYDLRELNFLFNIAYFSIEAKVDIISNLIYIKFSATNFCRLMSNDTFECQEEYSMYFAKYIVGVIDSLKFMER